MCEIPWWLHLTSPKFLQNAHKHTSYAWRYVVIARVWWHKGCWEWWRAVLGRRSQTWLIHTVSGSSSQGFFQSAVYLGSPHAWRPVSWYRPPLTSDDISSLKWVTAVGVYSFLIAVGLNKQTLSCLASWVAKKKKKGKKSSCLRATAFWELGISIAFHWSAKPAKQNQKAVAPACCCRFGLEHATSACVTQPWEQASLPCKPRRACILMLNVILGPLSFWQHFDCRPQFNTIIKCKTNTMEDTSVIKS